MTFCAQLHDNDLIARSEEVDLGQFDVDILCRMDNAKLAPISLSISRDRSLTNPNLFEKNRLLFIHPG
jgi:hypothetical protein